MAGLRYDANQDSQPCALAEGHCFRVSKAIMHHRTVRNARIHRLSLRSPHLCNGPVRTHLLPHPLSSPHSLIHFNHSLHLTSIHFTHSRARPPLHDRSVARGGIPGILASSARASRDGQLKLWVNSLSTLMVQVMCWRRGFRLIIAGHYCRSINLPSIFMFGAKPFTHSITDFCDWSIRAVGNGCWALRRLGERRE